MGWTVVCFCGRTITGENPVICPHCKEPIEPWASEAKRKIKDN
jgi:hypothetical protein